MAQIVDAHRRSADRRDRFLPVESRFQLPTLSSDPPGSTSDSLRGRTWN
ncbi:hypothetical protein AS9A_0764 [Hoyosella subflava DQS3-9A1]|uniref:Uncharacterized protein n=1 Tax=Hoyosella subflava (strain DSM 45089 / JCM 17490 / NBRC 109087 / DQS3-9A1) TaxID=443218 RepID=F6ELC6_HOYSD|nr:hypothetical protein AS9A_0764 [Hoyosella subflava DQS3-9A1]